MKSKEHPRKSKRHQKFKKHDDAETVHKHDLTKGAGAEGASTLCEGRPKAALHVCVLFLPLRVWDGVLVCFVLCFCVGCSVFALRVNPVRIS